MSKIPSCQYNFEKTYIEEKTRHTPSGYSFFTSCLFDPTKSKLESCRGKSCMEIFCKNLKEHTTNIIYYEKKEMIPLFN